MKLKKQFKNTVVLLMILGVFSFSLSGCSDKKEDEQLKEKLTSEMEYMDTKLVSMLNKVNGIVLKNYIVTSEKVKNQDNRTSEGGNNYSQDSSQDSSQAESNSDSSSSQGAESSQEGAAGDSGSQSKQNNQQYRMEANSILSSNRSANWGELKSDIENIYSSWSTITLDLYSQKIASQNILNFNTDLDIAIKAIETEDKNATLNSLSKLYSYIPIYTEGFLQDSNKVNIYKTKSNLLNAYAIIEQNNPNEVKKQLSLAEENFRSVVNNISSDTKNQGTINKSYIMIKDIQNMADITDSNMFYVKYKNLMEELNILD